ncbi:STAS domain-containing protein [Cellulomonas sp. P4]|uniref:STAS domain-containing protein n=1 Tax=Cellulomonas sp. P4 TaxID=3142533 RepID=UPI0031BA37F1
MDVSVASRTVDGRTVVDVTGEIDVYTAPALRERLTSLVDAGHTDLVVNLTDVRFMDSTGLGLLVGVLKRVRGLDGRLQLVIDSERLLKVFRITALTQVFTIRETVAEALADAPATD